VRVEQPWRGLWHPTPPGRRGDELFVRLVVYFVTPLALALLYDQVQSLERFGYQYLGALIVTLAIAGSFEALYHVARLVIRTKPSLPVRLAGHAAVAAVAVIAGERIALWVGGALLGWERGVQVFHRDFVISAVILTILIITDEMGARARDLERREAQLRVEALRAELAALQARTDPHFLFNSLNTVAALIPDDPLLAETLLVRLAAVFRYALDAGRTGTVELADELAAVTAYLEVEALRLGPRLAWRLDRADGVETVQVPPLVLQPLVENAIRHGADSRRGATTVVVTAQLRDDELVLAVEDQASDGTGEATPPRAGGAGTALADLRARLDLAYPGRGRLAAGAAPPAGWRAEVVVPVEPAA